MKKCSCCGEEKSLEQFNICASQKDGLQRYCRPCQKKKKSEWGKLNKEHVKKYANKWIEANKHKPEYKLRVRNHALRMWTKYPEKRSARTAVSNAIRDGRLQKQLCWVCGEKAEAHHVCYKDPMMISWLCREHHNQAHELLRSANEDSKILD